MFSAALVLSRRCASAGSRTRRSCSYSSSASSSSHIDEWYDPTIYFYLHLVIAHIYSLSDISPILCCMMLYTHSHRFESIRKPQEFYDLAANSTKSRSYFYNVDLHGRLFLGELLPITAIP